MDQPGAGRGAGWGDAGDVDDVVRVRSLAQGEPGATWQPGNVVDENPRIPEAASGQPMGREQRLEATMAQMAQLLTSALSSHGAAGADSASRVDTRTAQTEQPRNATSPAVRSARRATVRASPAPSNSGQARRQPSSAFHPRPVFDEDPHRDTMYRGDSPPGPTTAWDAARKARRESRRHGTQHRRESYRSAPSHGEWDGAGRDMWDGTWDSAEWDDRVEAAKAGLSNAARSELNKVIEAQKLPSFNAESSDKMPVVFWWADVHKRFTSKPLNLAVMPLLTAKISDALVGEAAKDKERLAIAPLHEIRDKLMLWYGPPSVFLGMVQAMMRPRNAGVSMHAWLRRHQTLFEFLKTSPVGLSEEFAALMAESQANSPVLSQAVRDMGVPMYSLTYSALEAATEKVVRDGLAIDGVCNGRAPAPTSGQSPSVNLVTAAGDVVCQLCHPKPCKGGSVCPKRMCRLCLGRGHWANECPTGYGGGQGPGGGRGRSDGKPRGGRGGRSGKRNKGKRNKSQQGNPAKPEGQTDNQKTPAAATPKIGRVVIPANATDVAEKPSPAATTSTPASRLVAAMLVVPSDLEGQRSPTERHTRIANKDVTAPSPRVVVVVDGTPLVATVDSGADACVIFKRSLLRTPHGQRKFNGGSTGTATVANGKGQSFRKVVVDIGIGSTVFEQSVIVFNEGPGDGVDMLLGNSLLRAMGGHAISAKSLTLFRGDSEVLETVPLLPPGASMPAAVHRVCLTSRTAASQSVHVIASDVTTLPGCETVAWTPAPAETLARQALWSLANALPAAGTPGVLASKPSVAKVAAIGHKQRRRRRGHERRQQKAVAKAAAEAAKAGSQGVRRSKQASYTWDELLSLNSLWAEGDGAVDDDDAKELASARLEILRRGKDSFIKAFGETIEGRKAINADQPLHLDFGEGPPIHIRRRVRAPHKEAAIDQHVEALLADGAVEPSRSRWSFPIVLVPKPHMDNVFRFCVDLRKANERAAPFKPLSPNELNVQQVLDEVAGSIFFAQADLSSAYFQLELDDATSEVFAFTTARGTYQFRRLPFGFVWASHLLAQHINSIIGDLDFVEVFRDDLIIHSATMDQHVQHVVDVMQRLWKANVCVSALKFKPVHRRVVFLGHTLTAEGVTTAPENVEKLRLFPRPTSVSAIRSFLGACNHYRRLIKHYAMYSSVLSSLTKKGTVWKWGVPEELAFRILKLRVTSAPVLKQFDWSKPFILETDASDKGLAATISQLEGDGVERLVAYWSQSLTAAQTNWTICERELAAGIQAMKHFDAYIRGGRRFVWRTDHMGLVYLWESRQRANGRISRWIAFLMSIKPGFTIVHRPGKLMGFSDAGSRIESSVSTARWQAAEAQFGSSADLSSQALSQLVEGVDDTEVQRMLDGWDREDVEMRQHDVLLHTHRLEEVEEDLHQVADLVNLDKLPELTAVVEPVSKDQLAKALGKPLSNSVADINQVNVADPDKTVAQQNWPRKMHIPRGQRSWLERHLRASHKDGPISPPSADQLRAAQRKNAELNTIRKALHIRHGSAGLVEDFIQLPEVPYQPTWTYCWDEGDNEIVCVRRHLSYDHDRFIVVPVIPPAYHSTFLHMAHDLPTSGHAGVKGTRKRLERIAWWRGCNSDVRIWVFSCLSCECSRKHSPLLKAAGLQLFNATSFNECVSVDVVGPYPSDSETGHQYIVSILDRFTRWVELIPVTRQDARTVATKVLDTWISRYGCPQQLLTDNGPAFISEVWRELCHRVGARLSSTTTYHCQTNGAVERIHRVLHHMLMPLVSEGHRDWASKVPLVAMAMRSAYHNVIKTTPYEALFARRMIMPADIILQKDTAVPEDLRQHVVDLASELHSIHKGIILAQHHSKQQMMEANARRYNFREETVLQPDDLVTMFYPNREETGARKLSYQRTGPWRVLERESRTLYKLEHVSTGASARAHVQNLRRLEQRKRHEPAPPHPEGVWDEEGEDINDGDIVDSRRSSSVESNDTGEAEAASDGHGDSETAGENKGEVVDYQADHGDATELDVDDVEQGSSADAHASSSSAKLEGATEPDETSTHLGGATALNKDPDADSSSRRRPRRRVMVRSRHRLRLGERASGRGHELDAGSRVETQEETKVDARLERRLRRERLKQGQPTQGSNPVEGRGQTQAESADHTKGGHTKCESGPSKLISSDQLATPTTARTMSWKGQDIEVDEDGGMTSCYICRRRDPDVWCYGKLRHSLPKGSVSDDLCPVGAHLSCAGLRTDPPQWYCTTCCEHYVKVLREMKSKVPSKEKRYKVKWHGINHPLELPQAEIPLESWRAFKRREQARRR